MLVNVYTTYQVTYRYSFCALLLGGQDIQNALSFNANFPHSALLEVMGD